jgi:hypothetical protein
LQALASDLENRDDAPSNAQRCPPPSDLPVEVPLTEPDELSNVAAFSSSIPAPTPAQRMKASNTLEQESHLGHDGSTSRRKSDEPMRAAAQLVLRRKIPRPTSPVPHDDTTNDPIVRVLIPNSDTTGSSSSQPIFSQTQSQMSQLSPSNNNHHVQAESTMDDYENNNSRALLRGITVDLKARDYPFLDLLRVREILERTHRYRYKT